MQRRLLLSRREGPRGARPPLLPEDETQLRRRLQLSLGGAKGRARLRQIQRAEHVALEEAVLAADLPRSPTSLLCSLQVSPPFDPSMAHRRGKAGADFQTWPGPPLQAQTLAQRPAKGRDEAPPSPPAEGREATAWHQSTLAATAQGAPLGDAANRREKLPASLATRASGAHRRVGHVEHVARDRQRGGGAGRGRVADVQAAGSP